MMSSKTLKTFVKMHEYKLNAKINGLQANRLETQIDADLHGAHDARNNGNAAEHWSLHESDAAFRRRPKSRYFNFILTPSHQ